MKSESTNPKIHSQLQWLHNGDNMTQKTFHSLYEQMPDDFKAELLGGTVFVCEPAGFEHGAHDLRLGTLFDTYAGNTTGVSAAANVTIILGPKDEVQPDVCMFVLPYFGGKSVEFLKGKENARGEKKTYLKGAPQLVAEVAHNSVSIDLHLKRKRYRRAGVLEYIVLCLEPFKVHWLDLQNDEPLPKDPDGIFRSKVFPGFWLNNDGLLNRDFKAVMSTLTDGLNSDGYSKFAANVLAGQE